MSFRSKHALLAQVAPRYQQATHAHKSIILDEFVAATGYARKYAILLLTRPPLPVPTQIRRPRAPHYEPAVQAALEIAWAATYSIDTRRLLPFLPKCVLVLKCHGQRARTDAVPEQLLAISPATADRLLRCARGRTATWALDHQGRLVTQAPDPRPHHRANRTGDQVWLCEGGTTELQQVVAGGLHRLGNRGWSDGCHAALQ